MGGAVKECHPILFNAVNKVITTMLLNKHAIGKKRVCGKAALAHADAKKQAKSETRVLYVRMA